MLSDRIYECNACGFSMDGDLNAAINIRNAGLIKVGIGTHEYTHLEIASPPVRATPAVETASPLH
jgi:putative transposase